MKKAETGAEKTEMDLRTKRAVAAWARDGDIGKHFTFGVGYSRCNCSEKGVDRGCEALKHEIPRFMDKFSFVNQSQSSMASDWSNETMCYCVYDIRQKTAWPCYEARKWYSSMCNQCSLSGTCGEVNGGGEPYIGEAFKHLLLDLQDIGEIPCMCQSVSHFCVALSSEPLNLWEEKGPTTTPIPEFEKAQGFQVKGSFFCF